MSTILEKFFSSFRCLLPPLLRVAQPLRHPRRVEPASHPCEVPVPGCVWQIVGHRPDAPQRRKQIAVPAGHHAVTTAARLEAIEHASGRWQLRRRQRCRAPVSSLACAGIPGRDEQEASIWSWQSPFMSACDPLIQAERRFKTRCLNRSRWDFFPCRGPVVPCLTLSLVCATYHSAVKPGNLDYDDKCSSRSRRD